MPADGRYRFLLTMIDRSSRWLECEPLMDISASTVAEAFVRVWVTRFGVPRQLVLDIWTQFLSSLFTSLCTFLGVHHTPSTSYHPCTNGLVETLHRSLKNSLRAHDAGHQWVQLLPWVLLGLRSNP